MTDENAKPGHAEPAKNEQKPSRPEFKPVVDPAPATENAAPETSEAEAPADLEAPVDLAAVLSAQIEELERQKGDLAERLAKAQEDIHRYQAEIQNLHRRREKETEEAGKYAIAKFAHAIVDVSDNFERATSAVPAEAMHDNPVVKSLIDGVSMTEREFLNVLERHGVLRISPENEPFDPHRHQAVMEEEDKSVPAGTVLKVFQKGYIIADRVLRPAMVVVSRGGPKPVKTPAQETATETEKEPPGNDGPDRESGPDPDKNDSAPGEGGTAA